MEGISARLLEMPDGSDDKARFLKLDVDETNIDELEASSCEEIYARRERLYRESDRAIPALDELISRHGDSFSRKVYMMSRDAEGRWLKLHERDTGIKAPLD
jgi:hypothetical protein